jgi:hypothetical protein
MKVESRFSGMGVGCQVHDGPRPASLEHPLEVFLVSQVAAFQRPPFDRSLMTAPEVVERHGRAVGADGALNSWLPDRQKSPPKSSMTPAPCIAGAFPHGLVPSTT